MRFAEATATSFTGVRPSIRLRQSEPGSLPRQALMREIAPRWSSRRGSRSPAFENQEAGAALWLARHGRDIGFLNGDWPEPLATQLDAAAKSLGICALYLGSERKVRHLDMPPRRPNSSFNLNYCAACQASPRWGFCQLPRCPHAPSDLFAVTSKAEPQEAR